MRTCAVPFDFAQGRLSGTCSVFPLYPALKRWARFVRPSGAKVSAVLVANPVSGIYLCDTAHTVVHWDCPSESCAPHEQFIVERWAALRGLREGRRSGKLQDE